ncbi:MAG: NAD(+)/NADH kinase [Pseudomonadaceae bacterium]|nr:NAD(+)/NADH kinase [Pseudomonadaceae bacterium]
MKGSDGADLQAQAQQRGGVPQAPQRCADFLQHLHAALPETQEVLWLTGPGPLGELPLAQAGAAFKKLDYAVDGPTSAADLRTCARMLVGNVDLLVFVGGDGTARDILSVIGESLPVLGVPAGVKMHSGVFAVSPRTAALLLAQLLTGGLVAPVLRAVRDYDNQAEEAEILLRTYGELRVPEAGGYLQQTKIGGKESEPLAVQEIVAHVQEEILPGLPEDCHLVLGPGSTCLAIKQVLYATSAEPHELTLRGVDVYTRDGQWLIDVGADTLQSLKVKQLVVSFTRGQGFLFGRGNQQISASFLRQLSWPRDVTVVGTRTKLASLEQRPLLLDTGDDALDQQLAGLVEIVTGYQDCLLYRLANQLE